jgi:hypothetical protein
VRIGCEKGAGLDNGRSSAHRDGWPSRAGTIYRTLTVVFSSRRFHDVPGHYLRTLSALFWIQYVASLILCENAVFNRSALQRTVFIPIASLSRLPRITFPVRLPSEIHLKFAIAYRLPNPFSPCVVPCRHLGTGILLGLSYSDRSGAQSTLRLHSLSIS